MSENPPGYGAGEPGSWEERLRTAARTGRILDLTGAENNDPGAADTWPEHRRIAARALRTVLLEPELHPDPRDLRIHGADITGDLDLESADLPCALHITDSRMQVVDLTGADTRPLVLAGTRAAGLLLRDAHIHGRLNLTGAPPLGAAVTGEAEGLSRWVDASTLET